MNDIDDYIVNWIKNVSKIRPEIGGFAICPFAKQAKYKIIDCNSSEIKPIDGFDVIIFVVESNFSCDLIEEWVQICNSKYPEWKFFEDCAKKDSYIKGVQTNNGKYNLILAQPKNKLKKYREILAKTNYYEYWNMDYLKEILEEDIDLIN